ncbi:MAG: DNA gyrase modulator, partial [Acidobacteriota bacterium]
MKQEAIDFFFSRFNITFVEIEKLLGVALSKGGDYADLYFEYRVNNAVSLEEQLVKSANKSISQGVGVRVNADDKTGYAFTDEISFESIRRAALTAAHIATQEEAVSPINVSQASNRHNLYPVDEPPSDVPVARKIELVRQADNHARQFDKRIREVQVSLLDEYKIIMI